MYRLTSKLVIYRNMGEVDSIYSVWQISVSDLPHEIM